MSKYELIPAAKAEEGCELISVNPPNINAQRQYYSEEYYPNTLLESMKQAKFERMNNRSHNTLRMYKHYWELFVQYCISHSVNSLPADPEIVSTFIYEKSMPFHNDSDKKNRITPSNSYLKGLVAAINYAHTMSGFLSPTTHSSVKEQLRSVMSKPNRTLKKKRKSALVDVYLQQVIDYMNTLDNTLKLKRDKALLLLGRQGGFRRTEIANLKFDDLEFSHDALVISLEFHKTSFDGTNKLVKRLPINEKFSCYDAMKDWLFSAKIEAGHVFRSLTLNDLVRPYFVLDQFSETEKRSSTGFLNGNDVYRICKHYYEMAGLLNHKQFGAHSLRSGIVTQMFLDGKQTQQVKKRTGHKSSAMVDEYNQVE